jgi:uncharacterized SAM-binding protein YcdF (DUF218 family)
MHDETAKRCMRDRAHCSIISVRKLLLLVVLLVVGFYALGAFLFLAHDDDALGGTADAVVVLAGDRGRLPVALELIRAGVAPVLVVSEDEYWSDEARYNLCKRGRITGTELICRYPVPDSTRGEVRFVTQLARSRGWRRLVVVTSRYHLFRAKRLFARCTDAELVFRGSKDDTLENLVAVPNEWAKLLLAETFRRGC